MLYQDPTDPDFNSRTSCEVRRPYKPVFHPRSNFNSRTSCEVRRDIKTAIHAEGDFNSRTSCEVRRAAVQSGQS